MARGKLLHDDARMLIVRMAYKLSVEDIHEYTGISERTIQRILENYRTFGTVARKPTGKVKGRPRLLQDEQAAVSSSMLMLRRRPTPRSSFQG